MPSRTWKDAYKEVKADLTRAVERNNEIADERDRLRGKLADVRILLGIEEGKPLKEAIEGLLSKLKELDGEVQRVPGLQNGARDARRAVDATLRALAQKKMSIEEIDRRERQLTELREQLDEALGSSDSNPEAPDSKGEEAEDRNKSSQN